MANAILDGTDAVMLSAESAVGRFPEEAVAMLARIAQATESQRAVASINRLQEFYRTHRPATVAEAPPPSSSTPWRQCRPTPSSCPRARARRHE